MALSDQLEQFGFSLPEEQPWVILKENHFVDCNDKLAQQLGYVNAQELLKTEPHPFMLSPECQPCGMVSAVKANLMLKIAKLMGQHKFEWVHTKKDGEHIMVMVQLTAHLAEDDTEWFIAIFNPICLNQS